MKKLAFIGRLFVVMFLWWSVFFTAAVSARGCINLTYWQAYKIDLRFEANCMVHYLTNNYQLFIF